MPLSFDGDFQFGRRFLPHMRRIAADHLIGEAPFEEDAHHATDLIVLRLEAVRIACRVRRHQYLKPYGEQFTIRTDRPSGTTTELAKILEGWGDYMIYGFAAKGDAGPFMARWVLGDLRAFRRWFHRELYLLPSQTMPGSPRTNRDGSSRFAAFNVADIPDFLVAQRNLQADAEAAG